MTLFVFVFEGKRVPSILLMTPFFVIGYAGVMKSNKSTYHF
jgi:hypothetical protein